MVLINQQHIELARMCAPAMDDVVDDVMSRWAVRLGLSESRAAAYVDVGIMLTDYPALGAYLDQGHLSFEHARKLADCLYCVPEEYREQVEAELLHALRPKRPNQMAFTVGRVKKVAQQIIHRIHPPARPRDDDNPPPPPPDEFQPELTWDDSMTAHTTFYLRLNKLDSLELRQMLEYVSAREKCSAAEALMLLLRGQTTAEATLNIYRPVFDLQEGAESEGLASVAPINGDQNKVWAAGQWLSTNVSSAWMQRVTHVFAPGFERCDSYHPTPSIRASVMGRDGHCRFPGCEVPAERCDLDHVRRWDHSESHGGASETSTVNLHCLCRKHHKLKTAGQWDVTLHCDGTETWTSHGDGHQVVTEPGGVLKRVTFENRAVRRTKRLEEYNQERIERYAWMDKVALAAREAAQMGLLETIDASVDRKTIEHFLMIRANTQGMRDRGEPLDYSAEMVG